MIKTISLAIIMAIMIIGCAEYKKSGWIQMPKGFAEYNTGKEPKAMWENSKIKLEGTSYTAGAGPYYFTDQNNKDYDYYCIDIEKPFPGGADVIAELNIPLSYVSKEVVKKKAEEIITFDKANKTVSFNLGNGTFIYKLE